MRLSSKNSGFTLIELLVVIDIIGLLSTLAVVSLNNARQKSRDAKRVSDIKQVQTSLELYYADKNGYPVSGVALTLGGASAKLLSGGGFTAVGGGSGTTYMGQVPANPTPALEGSENYSYISRDAAGAACAVAPCAGYTIDFGLEGSAGQLVGGTHVASPNGIQ
ncbi:MAG: prepilin-type N-terminal cleavage/methylation domain-containing protein [Candidatus Komeilibacteria bacterium]|nr:prepilin-type N-terminal cleavage/methylation domain-containing protein [Candidatus Komeilibacteria bacterium]